MFALLLKAPVRGGFSARHALTSVPSQIPTIERRSARSLRMPPGLLGRYLRTLMLPLLPLTCRTGSRPHSHNRHAAPFKPILLRTHGLCRSRSLGANALPLRLPCVDRPSVPCYELGGRVAQQVLLLPLPGCVSGRLQRRYTVSGLESLLSPCATVARKIEQPM